MSKTKILATTMLTGALAFAAGLWKFSTQAALGPFEYSVAAAVVLIVAFALFVTRGRLNNEKLGLPADDELSESIKQKAEAKAFQVSFYLWAFLTFVTILAGLPAIVPLGIGLVAMGAIFVGFWVYYNQTGLGHENAA